MRFSTTISISIACAIAFAAAPVRATVLADWSLADVAARADLVVLGRVVARANVVEGQRAFTETHIAVDAVLAGRAPTPVVVVRQIGGVLPGGRVQEIVGDAELAEGDRVVVFTYVHEDGHRYLVGMSLGVLYAERDGFVQRPRAPVVDVRGAVRARRDVHVTRAALLDVLGRAPSARAR